MANAIISCLILVFCALRINGYYQECNNNNECTSRTMDCTDNEDCSIDCTGYRSCRSSTINCPHNGNCFIKCTNAQSCQYITINGNTNNIINVECSKDNACEHATIDGRYASELKLLNCGTGSYTCQNIAVWCPQNKNGEKHCTIQGDNSIGGTFYAVNSWNDIHFETPDKTYYFSGNMYCTKSILSGDYSNSCAISAAGPWECSDSNSICQNLPIPTTTVSTTLTVTESTVSTETPTVTPTHMSTVAPTLNPTTTTTDSLTTTITKTTTAMPTVSPTETSTSTESPKTVSTNSVQTTKNPTSRPSDDRISIEVTKPTTDAPIDGKVNETPETISHSATGTLVTEFIGANENALISVIDSYGLYMILGILLFVVGCCCGILVIYKGRKSKSRSYSDNGIEMGKIKPRTRSLSEIKSIKSSPLGKPLTTTDLDILEAESSVSIPHKSSLQYSHSDHRKKGHHRLYSNSIANFYPNSMGSAQQFSMAPSLMVNPSIPTSVPTSIPNTINSSINNVNFVGNHIHNYQMYKHDEIEGEFEDEIIEINDDDDEFRNMNTPQTPFQYDMDNASSLINGNNNEDIDVDDLDVDYINVNMDEKEDDNDFILKNDDCTIGVIHENEGNI